MSSQVSREELGKEAGREVSDAAVSQPLGRRRALLLVLDGVGCGAAPDAADYSDIGSNTLGNTADSVGGLLLPNLQALGLGNIGSFRGISPVSDAKGAWGTMLPASAGKDSTTGHWELAGVHLTRPFPVYPNGFPAEVLEPFILATGRDVIGNVAASGTTIIADLAQRQLETGTWIVYTSADSVFQIAAHEQLIPLSELYEACELAREQLVAPHDVSRVIARPYVGGDGNWVRTSNRRDYSVEPHDETLLDALQSAGVPTSGVGKVDDLFAGRGIASHHTANNSEGIDAIYSWLASNSRGLCFANLVDFDTLYGHRNDVAGFAAALTAFDMALPRLLSAMREDDLLIITADHGNDPTTDSTDHAREQVPLLVVGRNVKATTLGVRPTFSDAGATIAEWLGISFRGKGESFLPLLTAS